MRTLSLQSPPMTGADVSAWQQFLTSEGVYDGAVDGVYGSPVAQATKAYQSSTEDLSPDGVVGTGTFAQALLDGFQLPEGTIAISGMDASVNCSAFASCIADTGRVFVVRYYSKFPAKILTRAEAVALSEAGLQVAAVYEDFDTLDHLTAVSGRQNAATALHLAAAVGQPAGSAIYFAADFNPKPADVSGPVSDYFRAVNQAFAAAPTQYAVGIYGSGLTCRIIRDTGLATFTWLSNSTSFLEWTPFRQQAHLLQAPERGICDGQLSIDDDIAQSANFGAFQVASSST